LIDGFHGALRQHRTQLEREIRRRPQLLDGSAEHDGRALPAELGVRTQLSPTAFDEFRVSGFELRRHAHAFGGPLRAGAIADLVDGIEHAFGEAAGFIEHGIGELGRVIRQSGKIRQAAVADQLVDGEADFFQRCFVHTETN
jgi:hypothetical protein